MQALFLFAGKGVCVGSQRQLEISNLDLIYAVNTE